MTAHLTEPAPAATAARPDTPPAVASALARVLEKDPAARFQTAREFGDALGISFTGEQTSASVVRTPRPQLIAAAAVVGIAIAGAAVWVSMVGTAG